MSNKLFETFGNIDIYLFDQLLKGRYDGCKKIIDVGCGEGRNIIFFLKNGYDVTGIDIDARSVEKVKALSKELAPNNPAENFIVARVEEMPFADASFDLVICNTVLHFAKDPGNFDEMLYSVWRILKPGGFLFTRLASDIGIETLVKKSRGNGRYLLPDGTERFLVNYETLMKYTGELGGELYEPIKTTNVSDLRCMTTWCVRKK